MANHDHLDVGNCNSAKEQERQALLAERRHQLSVYLASLTHTDSVSLSVLTLSPNPNFILLFLLAEMSTKPRLQTPSMQKGVECVHMNELPT
jgi:hypothetical protein